MYMCTGIYFGTRKREREREGERVREKNQTKRKVVTINIHVILFCLTQAKFMPHTGDSVLVTAARDGQIRCHVLSTSGNLMTSKRVSHHRDSAHKV